MERDSSLIGYFSDPLNKFILGDHDVWLGGLFRLLLLLDNDRLGLTDFDLQKVLSPIHQPKGFAPIWLLWALLLHEYGFLSLNYIL